MEEPQWIFFDKVLYNKLEEKQTKKALLTRK
jgi:hypothetical protein